MIITLFDVKKEGQEVPDPVENRFLCRSFVKVGQVPVPLTPGNYLSVLLVTTRKPDSQSTNILYPFSIKINSHSRVKSLPNS